MNRLARQRRPLPPGAWRCEARIPNTEGRSVGNPPTCVRCGSNLEHPVDVCGGGEGCGHLVVFHGIDTAGCGRICAAGWCACRRRFGRERAEFVRYA
jgi:hypothetical protein